MPRLTHLPRPALDLGLALLSVLLTVGLLVAAPLDILVGIGLVVRALAARGRRDGRSRSRIPPGTRRKGDKATAPS